MGHVKTAPRLTPGVKVPIPQGFKTRPGLSQGWEVQADRVVELRDEKLKRKEERKRMANEHARGNPTVTARNGATKTSDSGVRNRGGLLAGER